MTMQTLVKTRPTYSYYRQAKSGWITVSAATDTDELKYRREGWIPLLQYGHFDMDTPYMVAHPLEVLFMRGGAHELPVDQIRKQGLYIHPPVIPSCLQPLSQTHKRHMPPCFENAKTVVFPQLAGMTDLGPFPCHFDCGRDDLPTVEARNQHETVMHGPEKSDIRSGEALAEALQRGTNGQIASPAGVSDIPSEIQDLIRSQQEMLLRLKADMADLTAKQAAAVFPPGPTRTRYDRNQTKHTHGAPFGEKHLVNGCPRCEELVEAAV